MSYPLMLSKGAAIICQYSILSRTSSQQIRTLVIIPLQQSRSQRVETGQRPELNESPAMVPDGGWWGKGVIALN